MFGHHRQSGMHHGQGSRRGLGLGKDQRFCGAATDPRVELASAWAAPTENVCPLCRNHCPLDAPGCPKGCAFAARAAR
ncbi:hypothetical protein [Humidesulfovibrio idahonensis]